MIAKALTIAGSDPSGGAGLQADLKTFSCLRVYGMAVVSALTAQNTVGVFRTMDVPPDFLAAQLDAVMSDIPADAVKTGMLSSSGIVDLVAAKVRQYGVRNLVIDPVIVSTSGASLLQPDAVSLLKRVLLPLALVVTPNRDEAQILAGTPIETTEDMEEAALRIHSTGVRNVVIKGGHMRADATDVLFDGKEFIHFRAERIPVRDAHGTGCVFSAAMTAHLALGASVHQATQLAKEFVIGAIRNGLRIGSGQGPCDPLGLQE
jgi:hydroxymethylpyrimidine/phosphomethylpyrimidine kinase